MTEAPRGIRPRTHRLRTGALGGLWILLAVVFVLRSVQLQVVDYEKWTKRAEAQYATEVALPAERGAILDRHGRPLVLDARAYRGYVAVHEMDDPDRAIEAIGRVLGLSRREEAKLRRAEGGWVSVPRRVSAEDRNRLRSAVRRGLHFEPLAARVYPEGIARNLLGAISLEGVGQSGLEMSLDSLLKGEPGLAVTRRDGKGDLYKLPGAEISAPKSGLDVVLTIDAELQSIAEAALKRALDENGASGGDILIVDPRTGELLAVASQRSGSEMAVPAFTDPYEPGSTLKPFLLAALLNERAVRLDDTIDVHNGIYKDGRRVIRDVHPYDSLAVAEVIRYSSNVGAVLLAKRLSQDLHYSYLRDFGFGLPTGIDYPSEAAGVLRRPKGWSALSQASLAMGYEISLTSLQLAMAYSALANGGRLLKPRLLKEVRERSGRTVESWDPEQIRRVVDGEITDQVTEVLASVVEDGTGTRAALNTLTVAGKSGTARLLAGGRYERKYAASFVAYSPAEDPSLVILAKIENPQGRFYGGSVAAPISRDALLAALATRGVSLSRGNPLPPSARHDWGMSEPLASDSRTSGPFVFAVNTEPQAWSRADDREVSRRLPDLRGLSVRSAAARLHALGLRARLETSGRIRVQRPGPGEEVSAGSVVLLK